MLMINANNLKKHQQGFTLVELSLVLVIIGLLIGGILVAQSMISTSKLQNLYRETTQYDVMINLFKARYGTLPGDDPGGETKFNVVDGGGDGNGLIVAGTEGIQAWQVMYNGLGDNKYVCKGACDAGEPAIPGLNIPTLSWDKGVGISMGISLPAGHNAFILGKRNLNLSLSTGGFLTPAEALAIDQKFDDGKANSGSIWAHGLNTCVSGSQPSRYLTTSQEKACSIDIFMTTAN